MACLPTAESMLLTALAVLPVHLPGLAGRNRALFLSDRSANTIGPARRSAATLQGDPARVAWPVHTS